MAMKRISACIPLSQNGTSLGRNGLAAPLLLIRVFKMKHFFLVAWLAISSTASAVVIRGDVEDAKYRIPASAFPALVDMPGEGHGVLIAPQWVVTAAHAAPMQGMEGEVLIGGVLRKFNRVVTYPGYQRMPDPLVQDALASGDLSRVHAFLASSNDIALVELASPITDVAPIALYRGSDEVGMTVQLVGKGATGNGVEGQDSHGSHRTVLRRALNVIVGTDARYVSYRFDSPPSALPLEGISGSGDSGGPLFIADGSSMRLVGLASWGKYPAGHPFWNGYVPGGPFVEGLYGQIVYGVRISRYIRWMEGVIAAPENGGSGMQPAAANIPALPQESGSH